MDGRWQRFGDTRGTRKSPCPQGGHAGGVGEEDKQTDIYKTKCSLKRDAQGVRKEGRGRRGTREPEKASQKQTELSSEEGF